MNIPITGEIGELLREVRAALIDGVGQRVSAAGFGDVRANHDCVFSYLLPQGTPSPSSRRRPGWPPNRSSGM